MITSRRTWVGLAGVSLVAGMGLVQLGATPSSKADAVDLGTLGGVYASAFAVNSRGHVVGQAGTTDGSYRAFLWQEREREQRLPWDPTPVGEMTDLGTLPGLPNSVAQAVNDRDQVVGNATGTGSTGAYTTRAFIWEGGQLKALPTLPGLPRSWASDISARGQVVGLLSPEESAPQAALWQRGVVELLPGLPGYALSAAIAINGFGEIVGLVYSSDPTHSYGSPVTWRRGVPTALGLPTGYDNGSPADINSRGQVVGGAWVGEELRCVLWNNGVTIDLGMLPGHDKCFARSINDRGEVAGYLALQGTGKITPFIWQSGLMTDLNAYVPSDSGWYLGFVMGMDGGALVGRGSNATGSNRAFKLQIW